MPQTIPALTFDIKKDSWENSKGFFKREIPMPILDEKQNPQDAVCVILEIKYAGVCGSDRGIWHREAFHDLIQNSLEKEGKTQRILGHELFGEIVQAGSLVGTLYDLKVGDPVSGDSHVTCGKCYQCKQGKQHVCTNEQILGISIDGIFAKYVKVPAKNLWKVNLEFIKPETACLFDPFGNAVHACTAADVRGQRVAVIGCGQIGLFSIQLLKIFGAADIIGIDVNEKNLAKAKALGAHFTVKLNPSEEKKENPYEPDKKMIERIMEISYGKGVDVCLELSGHNSSVNNAIEMTCRGGDIILFGIKDGDFIIPKFSQSIIRGFNFHCVIGRQIFRTWHIAQRLLADEFNGIQNNIHKIILEGGKETIIPFSEYSNELFSERIKKYPKLIFKMD